MRRKVYGICRLLPRLRHHFESNTMSANLRHPPSPTALTPRKCFNPSALNARTHRAWDRQPRATTVIDGRPRTIWKRFEAGSDQDKENVVEEVVAFEEKQPESDVDLGRSPTKKAVKKICLADRQVVVKGWERRDSGLMREFCLIVRRKQMLIWIQTNRRKLL